MSLNVDDLPFVRSGLGFLSRDEIYEVEKPYRLRYEPEAGHQRSNVKPERINVKIHNVRPILEQLSIDRNGFELHDFETTMSYADFDDPRKIEDVYMSELRHHIKTQFGARDVVTLDYVLRKRHKTFPISTGKNYEFNQPNMLAHVDVTLQSAKDILGEVYPTAWQDIIQARIQCITLWRPLMGPVLDWPLALCDAATVNVEDDIVPADVVYRSFVAENCMVHHNEEQTWCYIHGQTSNELLVFKATDSEQSSSKPCAHGAFPLPDRVTTSPRESIDVRALVLYADMQYPERIPWSTT